MAVGTIRVLRVLLAMIMGLLLIAQLWLLPLVAWEMARSAPEFAMHAVPLGVIVGLGFVGAEVVVWCIWRLTGLVRDDVVFGERAFRYVDLMIRAFAAIAALAAVVFGYVFAIGAGPLTVPLAVLAVVVTAGAMALLVVVLRALLRTAVQFEADLAEVV